MLRLNSTVMALSPLGRIRGGESVAAMACHTSRFCFEVEFVSKQMACKFNKLIGMPAINWADAQLQCSPSGEARQRPLTRCPRPARCAGPTIPLKRSSVFDVPDPRSDQD